MASGKRKRNAHIAVALRVRVRYTHSVERNHFALRVGGISVSSAKWQQTANGMAS